MANTFIKPTVIVRTALGLLEREIVIPGLVWTDGLGDFAGSFNDTISLRVPGRLTARRRNLRGAENVAAPTGRQIISDSLTETKVDVTLDQDSYSSVKITDEELTLDIADFGAQVLAPQVRAVAEDLEAGIVSEMQAADYETEINLDVSNPYNGIVDARKALNDANVPLAGRRLVVGSAVEAAILKSEAFRRVDQSGSDNALREAMIGKIAGFDVYTSNALAEDEAYAFHMTAFILAMRAPMIPDGATFGKSESYQGLAMRWLRDYDYANVQDRSLVDTFFGTAVVEDGADGFIRAVKLNLQPTAINATPATSTKAAGQTTQLTVTTEDADGSVRTVTADASYVSSDPTKATVSASGLVSFVATGSATITVSYAGRTDTVAITVS